MKPTILAMVIILAVSTLYLIATGQAGPAPQKGERPLQTSRTSLDEGRQTVGSSASLSKAASLADGLFARYSRLSVSKDAADQNEARTLLRDCWLMSSTLNKNGARVFNIAAGGSDPDQRQPPAQASQLAAQEITRLCAGFAQMSRDEFLSAERRISQFIATDDSLAARALRIDATNKSLSRGEIKDLVQRMLDSGTARFPDPFEGVTDQLWPRSAESTTNTRNAEKSEAYALALRCDISRACGPETLYMLSQCVERESACGKSLDELLYETMPAEEKKHVIHWRALFFDALQRKDPRPLLDSAPADR